MKLFGKSITKGEEEKASKPKESEIEKSKVKEKTAETTEVLVVEETKAKKRETGGESKLKKIPESAMAKFFSETPTPPGDGDLVEGVVIEKGKSKVFINLEPYGTGIIYGREYINVRDVLKKTNIGDKITAKVVDVEGEDGYIELSLKEARQALVWSEAEKAMKEKRALELTVKEANKGGLIIDWQGISGFLPASQLKTEHYPRVEDGDKERILGELKKLVDQKIEVSIIGVEPKENKLIFSEKGPEQKEKKKILDKYELGDTVEGEITGIVEFGVFIKIEDGLEGLAHISELDWGLVEDPKELFNVGQKIKAKIIEISDDKISLSIKQLKENPWEEATKKYQKGKKVEAVIIKFNKHGALASVEEGIAGLVHVSEFGTEEKLRKTLELGKTYPFIINIFEPKEHKMTLSVAGHEPEILTAKPETPLEKKGEIKIIEKNLIDDITKKSE
jgi:small subunit ribosomal protein S1